jgi:hypothetical protein
MSKQLIPMKPRNCFLFMNLVGLFLGSILLFVFSSCEQLPNHTQIAKEKFNEDYQWFVDNIPFFECSDKEIENVYYYRWKLYKAHLRNVGPDKFIITEFINHVPWDKEPFCTINAASMHHIYEGRWLRNPSFINGYIYNLYQEGGNNRQYSESVADATYASYLVNADKDLVINQLDRMKAIFKGWDDHWDVTKNLYYIPAMPDATEYTIASIDATGGKEGFDGGEAFRPTVNSYMYGNALAIARIAALKGDAATSLEYNQKAAALQIRVQQDLWNDSLQHFIDRFKVDNQFVHYWDFIRGRELAGFAPWYFNLPEDNPIYHAAWKHLTDTSHLLGKYGFRTNEPTYEYYFKQFTFHEGKRGSQWNGPSWPYQTSQAITGMANFINNYDQDILTSTDYLKSLRLFTRQHYLPDGKINLVENYDPNLGGPIVYFYWSNHYLHSSYNNLVITGLCGIRPSESDTLTINPLIDNSIDYFYLGDVSYHGHQVTIVYDKDGKKYKMGKGISVLVDGKKAKLEKKEGKIQVYIGEPIVNKVSESKENYALNISKNAFPKLSASVNSQQDSLLQIIDGKIWYFPEITNRWTTFGSQKNADWLEIDFGKVHEISMLKIYPFTDHVTFEIPENLIVEFQTNGEWKPVQNQTGKLIGNTANSFQFDKVSSTRFRISFKHSSKQVAFSEIEFY